MAVIALALAVFSLGISLSVVVLVHFLARTIIAPLGPTLRAMRAREGAVSPEPYTQAPRPVRGPSTPTGPPPARHPPPEPPSPPAFRIHSGPDDGT
jgi:hypothetical protein